MKKIQTEREVKPQISFANDKKYTVAELAAEINKSTKSIYRLIKERKLKAYRFGKDLIITASQLNDYADQNILKKWFPNAAYAGDLDPAYVPPEEIDITELTLEEIESAFVTPYELYQ